MQGGIIAPVRPPDVQGALDQARKEAESSAATAGSLQKLVATLRESEATLASRCNEVAARATEREAELLKMIKDMGDVVDKLREAPKEDKMQGGIIVPAARRNPIRVSEGRIRGELDDFSPWKGLIYDCGKRGPQLSSIEELEADLKNGRISSVRFVRLNVGTAESDEIWRNCVSADYSGCGGISRFVRGIGLGLLSPGMSASEFIALTARPKFDFGPHAASPESLYRAYFRLGSKADMEAGAFSKECGTDFSPGIHIGWAVENGLSKRVLSSLEGGCVSHVFWMWWVG